MFTEKYKVYIENNPKYEDLFFLFSSKEEAEDKCKVLNKEFASLVGWKIELILEKENF